jgi:hypothetical protein
MARPVPWAVTLVSYEPPRTFPGKGAGNSP